MITLTDTYGDPVETIVTEDSFYTCIGFDFKADGEATTSADLHVTADSIKLEYNDLTEAQEAIVMRYAENIQKQIIENIAEEESWQAHYRSLEYNMRNQPLF